VFYNFLVIVEKLMLKGPYVCTALTSSLIFLHSASATAIIAVVVTFSNSNLKAGVKYT